ncbi:MAG: hypothetical protein K2X27_07255 [Candidatus Obscuribacterales bacterium]|nr:hypothetical protein [Candidatus Obscuribacterales bacterium]
MFFVAVSAALFLFSFFVLGLAHYMRRNKVFEYALLSLAISLAAVCASLALHDLSASAVVFPGVLACIVFFSIWSKLRDHRLSMEAVLAEMRQFRLKFERESEERKRLDELRRL